MTHPPRERPVSFWTTLGWAVYLACSWTWCIGMFFPVLLARDFGLWGFVVFAVPNVIGAAAMGWVLRGRHAPRAILEKHQSMVRAFAIVTIVFQAYFLGVLLNWTGFLQAGSGVLLVLLAAGLLVPVANRARWLAAGVFVLSAGCAVLAWRAGSLARPTPVELPVELLWLAPVSLFGFALCPYLDPTFLRAAEMLHDGSRKVAFTLGFVVFFLPMILFTLAYGGALDTLLESVLRSETLRGVIFLHIGAQLTFTALVHLRELGRMRPSRRWPWVVTGLAMAAVFFGSAALDYWPDLPAFKASAGSPELYYRVFLSFYGLIFPAFVWLCMIPTRDGHAGLAGSRGRRKLLVWCAAVGIAAPLYWMGFIMLEEFYLVPGLGVVLLARLAVR
ncbi:hypothetical protein MNBD_PLANCTO03-1399 [hydrothermal vent metagenome]|uniref:Uncharacterized protein n=1 Tax=hydrothermal vent metagenome TaxID=652676 RepID=A0A3B1D5H4_9ZZZZ